MDEPFSHTLDGKKILKALEISKENAAAARAALLSTVGSSKAASDGKKRNLAGAQGGGSVDAAEWAVGDFVEMRPADPSDAGDMASTSSSESSDNAPWLSAVVVGVHVALVGGRGNKAKQQAVAAPSPITYSVELLPGAVMGSRLKDARDALSATPGALVRLPPSRLRASRGRRDVHAFRSASFTGNVLERALKRRKASAKARMKAENYSDNDGDEKGDGRSAGDDRAVAAAAKVGTAEVMDAWEDPLPEWRVGGPRGFAALVDISEAANRRRPAGPTAEEIIAKRAEEERAKKNFNLFSETAAAAAAAAAARSSSSRGGPPEKRRKLDSIITNVTIRQLRNGELCSDAAFLMRDTCSVSDLAWRPTTRFIPDCVGALAPPVAVAVAVRAEALSPSSSSSSSSCSPGDGSGNGRGEEEVALAQAPTKNDLEMLGRRGVQVRRSYQRSAALESVAATVLEEAAASRRGGGYVGGSIESKGTKEEAPEEGDGLGQREELESETTVEAPTTLAAMMMPAMPEPSKTGAVTGLGEIVSALRILGGRPPAGAQSSLPSAPELGAACAALRLACESLASGWDRRDLEAALRDTTVLADHHKGEVDRSGAAEAADTDAPEGIAAACVSAWQRCAPHAFAGPSSALWPVGNPGAPLVVAAKKKKQPGKKKKDEDDEDEDNGHGFDDDDEGEDEAGNFSVMDGLKRAAAARRELSGLGTHAYSACDAAAAAAGLLGAILGNDKLRALLCAAAAALSSSGSATGGGGLKGKSKAAMAGPWWVGNLVAQHGLVAATRMWKRELSAGSSASAVAAAAKENPALMPRATREGCFDPPSKSVDAVIEAV